MIRFGLNSIKNYLLGELVSKITPKCKIFVNKNIKIFSALIPNKAIDFSKIFQLSYCESKFRNYDFASSEFI